MECSGRVAAPNARQVTANPNMLKHAPISNISIVQASFSGACPLHGDSQKEKHTKMREYLKFSCGTHGRNCQNVRRPPDDSSVGQTIVLCRLSSCLRLTASLRSS
ncbi:hypothetical protein SBA3_3230027 [Candidatus Sulfopaludibacter sp. SbA3]|nr:hypothetical protein SBA3_3230027 [Candidatus Sulfopaludibacter sp. SbA3]